MKITIKEQEVTMGAVIKADGEDYTYMIIPSIDPNSNSTHRYNEKCCVLLRLNDMELVSGCYDNPKQLLHSEFNGTKFAIKSVQEIVVL